MGKEKKKEAIKKQEKSVEVRNRADAKKEEEMVQLKAELDKAQLRSTNKLNQIKEAHEKHVAGKQQFWDDLAVRLSEHEDSIQTRLYQIHKETNNKQQTVATRRQEIEADRKSNEEFINQRRADAHARVAATAIGKWNTTESSYRDIQKR